MEQPELEVLDQEIRPLISEAWQACEREMDTEDTLLYLLRALLVLAELKGLYINIDKRHLQ
jgi:hypothetical protein